MITAHIPRLISWNVILIFSSVNYDISMQYVNYSSGLDISHCPMAQAAYVDDISNDAIKTGLPILEKSLLHQYNTVTFSHTFPDLWNEGIVTPIHKQGNKLDVDNYRGIIISSCFGKIFLKIITTRIESYMYRLDLWKVNECGFKKDHQTENNIFILNTLYKSCVTKGNAKMYLAFVDFSKFFDTINRDVLFYKLLKYGVSGPVYKVIKSMYSTRKYRVRIDGHLSPNFLATSGVKQGCPMSPILSNIFQNDLHEIFDNGCDPVKAWDICINSISWADDLLLVSNSKNGLQQCLNQVYSYCEKWGLVVNTNKTKTIVMSKHTFTNENFNFGEMSLQCVRSFNHLGFQINFNGKFRNLVQDRILKATKMSNMVLRAIGHNKNVSVKLALSLFDKQLSLYCYTALRYGHCQIHRTFYTFWINRKILVITQDSWSRSPSQTQWAEICRMNMQGAWGRDPMPVIEKLLFVFIASRTKIKFCVVVKIQRMSLWILILSPIISWKTA